MGAIVGGETLQELRICFALAEQEREGGVSPVLSPVLSITDIGNIIGNKCKFTLPTVDIQRN